LESIRDRKTRNRLQARLDRLEVGNLGDHKAVGEGIFELRLQFGAGHRIYFGEVDNTIILLLCGGDKSSQARDIERAKAYWREYKEFQQ
jgi:putative addiction module killer protein